MRWLHKGRLAGGGLEAKRDAERNLAEARAQRPEVLRVAASLRDLRTRNHFGESLAATYRLRGGRP